MRCSRCNSVVKDGDKYCACCGNNIGSSSNSMLGIISIIFGVLSLIFGILFLPLSIIGLILGLCQKDKSIYKTIGIVINSICLFIALIVWILIFVLLVNAKDFIFSNNGFRDLIERFVTEEKYNDSWDKYSVLREGALGKEKTLEGTWKVLDDSSSGIVFRDGKVYLYTDINNLEDNYWYGTYEYVDDEEATEFINSLDINYNYSVIEITITKGIFDGKNNNNRNGSNIYGVAFIDHYEEGIEARFYGEEDSVKYYVKMSD